jgi:3-dehydroquinate synthase
VESATGYTRWLHGEAIGAGLLMAAAMSHECGFISSEDVTRVARLVERTNLPTHIEGVSPDTALDHMRIDKKVQAGRIRLVLLRKLGDAFVTADYPAEALNRTLQTYFG